MTDKNNHFDTVTINVKQSGISSSDAVLGEFEKYGMNLRKIDDSHVSLAFNETTSLIDLDEIIEIFADLKGHEPSNGFLANEFYEKRQYRGP